MKSFFHISNFILFFTLKDKIDIMFNRVDYMLERTILIVKDKIELIKNAKILIIGIGGVGSYALETLVRTGFSNITIVDSDIVDITNLNRQLMSLNSNIGLPKVDVFEKRIKDINPNCKVLKIQKFITKENIGELFNIKYDYVIDACDTIDTKKELIKYCLNNKIKIISSMGMGNRLDNTKIKLTTLDKTTYDPLAKKLRQILRKENISLKIPVVCSFEEPIKNNKIGSLAYVTGTAGLLITNYIVNDLLGELCRN